MNFYYMHDKALARYLERESSLIPSARALMALGSLHADSVAGAMEYLGLYWRPLDPPPTETIYGGEIRMMHGPCPIREAAAQRAEHLSTKSTLVSSEAVIQSWYQRGLARWVLGRLPPKDEGLLDTLYHWADTESYSP